MTESAGLEPNLNIQLSTPVSTPGYPDPPRERYVEVTGADLALICGEEGPAGPCLTCRYSEGMAGKMREGGMVGEAPIEAMKCWRTRMLVLIVGAAIRYGCARWEREPGADD